MDGIIRLATMKDLNLLVKLQKEEGHALGFLPTFALERCIEDRHVMMAEENGDAAAFVLFRNRGRRTTIYQTAALYDVRRLGLCSDLARTVQRVGGAAGTGLVNLACADDLAAANAFWNALGFRQVGIAPAGKSRKGAKLNLWEAPTVEQFQPDLLEIPTHVSIKQGESASERYATALAAGRRREMTTKIDSRGDMALFTGCIVP